MRKYGLIGYPLGHSFSKQYFTTKFEKEGLTDCSFELYPITEIGALPALIESEPGLFGLSVTIPYKKQVLAYLDDSKLPDGINACNSIRIRQGKLTGYNTDAIGFEKSFIPLLQPHHQRALVLGNGGASEAVVYVLGKLGIACNIVSRQIHNGSTLTYGDLDEQVLNGHQIIINASPVGTFPNVEECPSIPYEFISSGHLLFDLVYNPVKSEFLRRGEEQGALIRNGYDMLVLQAEESWKIWND